MREGMRRACSRLPYSSRGLADVMQEIPLERSEIRQMETFRETVKAVADQLRIGASDEDIIRTYGISRDSIDKLRKALADRGLLTCHDREVSKSSCAKKPKKSIDAKKFLASFRAASDDSQLMQEYGLNPKQLKHIYKALIEKGLLSEYEYYYRQRKAPELDEPTENLADASTKVSLVESISDETRRLYSIEHAQMSKSASDRDSQNADAVSGGNRRDERSTPGSLDKDRAGYCPRCHRPKDSSSPDTCIHCGVIYSKFARRAQGSGISMWDFDFRER
jgi:hypothetical protein